MNFAKKLIIFTAILFSQITWASEDVYILRLNKVLSDNCRVAVYTNLSQTTFAKIAFTQNSSYTFEEFNQNKNEILKSEIIKKYDFMETFGSHTKNHIFYVEENNLFIKYQMASVINNETVYSQEDNLLFENVHNCINE